MKKILLVCLTLIISTGLVFGANVSKTNSSKSSSKQNVERTSKNNSSKQNVERTNKNNSNKNYKNNKNSAREQMGNGGRERGRGRDYFGISEEDYNKLNLSKVQKKKIEEINKKYRPEMKEGQRPDFKEMEKYREKENKAFRSILTDTQKKQYDKAVYNHKSKEKEMMSKRYAELGKELNFTSAQKKKLSYMLQNNNGNMMEMDKKFESILTDKQKKTYKEKKEKMMKGGQGGPRDGQSPERKSK